MKTLIIYSSKYGTTEKCAKKLSEGLTMDVDLVNLAEKKNFDLTKYDQVIIGSSVYMGRIRKAVRIFCDKNMNTLITKRLGLFICGMNDNDDSLKQITSVYPEELMKKAIAKSTFGGEFIVDKMGFLDKMLTKKISNITTNTSKILEDNIKEFISKMNN